jgi:hypothetical protein
MKEASRRVIEYKPSHPSYSRMDFLERTYPSVKSLCLQANIGSPTSRTHSLRYVPDTKSCSFAIPSIQYTK